MHTVCADHATFACTVLRSKTQRHSHRMHAYMAYQDAEHVHVISFCMHGAHLETACKISDFVANTVVAESAAKKCKYRFANRFGVQGRTVSVFPFPITLDTADGSCTSRSHILIYNIRPTAHIHIIYIQSISPTHRPVIPCRK